MPLFHRSLSLYDSSSPLFLLAFFKPPHSLCLPRCASRGLYSDRDVLHLAVHPADNQQAEQDERFSIDRLRARFAAEDIELVCTRSIPVDIAVIHPSDEDGQPLFDKTMVTLHFADEVEGYKPVGATVDDVGNLSLGEIADLFAIKPDEQVWEVIEQE